MTTKKKVLLGMSGGVDSSAAALLLQKEGYEVEGVTLRLRPDTEPGSGPEAHGASGDIRDAALVAEALHIPHSVLDLREEFRDRVIENFAKEYAAGRTPNPCAVCNRYIKFGAMLDYALQHGFDLTHLVNVAGFPQGGQHIRHQPMIRFQTGNPTGQVQGYFPHRELVQQAGKDSSDILLCDIDAVDRQHGDPIFLPQPGG